MDRYSILSAQAKGLSYDEAVILGFLIAKHFDCKSKHTLDLHSFFHVSISNIHEATGIGRNKVSQSIKRLNDRGYLELKIRRSSTRLYFKLIFSKVDGL